MQIIVIGLPAPQGSKSFKGMRVSKKTGRSNAVLVESSKKVRPWRKAVEAAGRAVMAMDNLAPMDGPIVGRMVFTLPKPASAPKTRRTTPCVWPDISKLIRSTEDALKDAGVYVDDSRIIGYSLIWKCYPGEHPESLPAPGVRITLRTLADYEQRQAERAKR